ncbi:hypothetical protein Leryth_016687 [Lithospermum erythrorhizon]|nr:hypothetical protein Leryth_016687 [Lithospermum erythrorhizon]
MKLWDCIFINGMKLMMLKVCVFSCFLVLQESFAVSGGYTSVVPAFAPIVEETIGQIYNAKTFPRNAPSSASPSSGTIPNPSVGPVPLNFVPEPKTIAPSLLPNVPTSMPPSSSDDLPGTSSGSVPISQPSNDQVKSPQNPGNYVVGPQTPEPIASPSRQSPQKSATMKPPMPEFVPPNPNQNSSIDVPNVPLEPGEHNSSPKSTPYPDISSGKPVAAPVAGLGNHHLPVNPSPAYDVAPHPWNDPARAAKPVAAPMHSNHLPPAYHSTTNAPSAQRGKEDLKAPPPLPYPYPAPNFRSESPGAVPSTDTQRHHYPIHRTTAPAPTVKEVPTPLPYSSSGPNFGSESPVAAPSTDTRGHHYPIDNTKAPASTMKGAPPPLSYPDSAPNFGSEPPASVPSTATQRHHYPVNRTTAPSPVKGVSPPLPDPIFAPNPEVQPPSSFPRTTTPRHHHQRDKPVSPSSSISGVPHASPQEEPDYQKTDFRNHASPPLRSEDHYSPAPSVFGASPPRTITVPLPPPKSSHARSLPKFPKMPVQLLPPPPPDEDCATLTCSEPLTNGPPGPPCLCVLPILVGLRLNVALYTFFPLVSELAVEISAGLPLQQSQVHIMGANEATQDPEKTIVLIDLVPIGEKFDRTTAYLIFQRLWYKQVDIKASLFSDYEVLYVRYPGLPPSPPSASPDIDAVYNDPYHNHENNARTMKPFGVDVSRMRHNKGPNRSVIAIIVLSASLALILSCVLVWVFLFKNRSVSVQERIPPGAADASLGKSSGGLASLVGSGPSSASVSLRSGIAAYTGSAKTFSSSEIERATSNFNEMGVLGEGGFGRVYSGVLDDGTEVAVKVLKRDDHQGSREFLAEVEMLSRLHHRNLLKLIGICIEERARSLVYELIPNGSVESHLHGVDKGTAPLDWSARLKIALGAARGLAYLHEDSSPRVIHRDFKASNILLEHDFTPKVSDFGLARIALDENRHISTRVMGTFGYVAPEYAMTGHLLVKSDVYSYGVVLLELLTGRKPVDMSQPPGEENLVSCSRPLLTSKEGLELIVDQSLGPNFPVDSITKVAAIASMCVQPEVSNRPFMGEVVQALKLVYNECEETKEVGSRRCQEDISIDMDERIRTYSELDPPHCTLPEVSHHDSRIDFGNVYSVSELLSSSMRSERIENESVRRHSTSGPLRSMNTRWLLQHMRRLSGGSISEHGVIYRLRARSH